MKVLLVTPPYHCGVLESAGVWLPLSFVYIAGSLREAGHEVKIYDAMSKFHDIEDIKETIKAFQPDVVGTGAFTATVLAAIETLEAAKKVDKSIITILGGVHPTFCWQEILENDNDKVDYIIRGEGELTFKELLDYLIKGKDLKEVSGLAFEQNGEIICTPDRPFIEDLDSIPAAWDLIEWPLYYFRTKPNSTLAIINTSRGCTQKCTFCSQRLFWKEGWRARAPENIVNEIEYLNSEFGVNVVMFSDETPSLERERWERLLDLLIERDLDVEILMETRVDDIVRDEDIIDKYALAKILHIYVGVESGSQETLNRFHKNIKVEQSKKAIELINQAGIISETSFVLGMPDDTNESIRKTIELAKYYDPDMCFFLAIAPWPYSEIYDELKPYIKITDYSKYNLVVPVVKPINMTMAELNKQLMNAFKEFYMNKFTNLHKMSNFKKDYMIRVMKLFYKHSYLAQEMKGMGKMPEKIFKVLKSIKVS